MIERDPITGTLVEWSVIYSSFKSDSSSNTLKLVREALVDIDSIFFHII